MSKELLKQYVLSTQAGLQSDDSSIEAMVYNSAIRKVYIMYKEAERWKNDTVDLERPNALGGATTQTFPSSFTDLIENPTLQTKKQSFNFYREPVQII